MVRYFQFNKKEAEYFRDLIHLHKIKKNPGLSLALLEAMAYGLPGIVTNITGNNEAVRHGYNGLLVTPGSVEELTEAMRRLLTNREERERMGANARKRAEEDFALDETIAQVKSIILTSLSKG